MVKMTEEICQGCGERIKWGSQVIAVRYGIIHARVRHTSVTKERVDYFHRGCEVAILSMEDKLISPAQIQEGGRASSQD